MALGQTLRGEICGNRNLSVLKATGAPSHEHIIDFSIVKDELTPQYSFDDKTASCVEALRRQIRRQNPKGDALSAPRADLSDRSLHERLSYTTALIVRIDGHAVDLPDVSVRGERCGLTKLNVSRDAVLVCGDQHVGGVEVLEEWRCGFTKGRRRVFARSRQPIDLVQSISICCRGFSNRRHSIMMT